MEKRVYVKLGNLIRMGLTQSKSDSGYIRAAIKIWDNAASGWVNVRVLEYYKGGYREIRRLVVRIL
jgi:hypothetical protein